MVVKNENISLDFLAFLFFGTSTHSAEPIYRTNYYASLTKDVNNGKIASGDKLLGYQDIFTDKKLEKITIDGKLYLPNVCGNENYWQ